MGRKAYKRSDETAKIVTQLSAVGIPQDDICKVISISKPTLEKYYREELDTAAVRANAKVAGTLFNMATSGDCPAATIFWLKTRMGWRETDQLATEQPRTLVFVDDPEEIRVVQ